MSESESELSDRRSDQSADEETERPSKKGRVLVAHGDTYGYTSGIENRLILINSQFNSTQLN